MLIDIPVTYPYQDEEMDGGVGYEVGGETQSSERQVEEEPTEEEEIETSKLETDPSEGSFLVYDDGGACEDVRARMDVDITNRKAASLSDHRSLSSFSAFEFESMSSDLLPMRTPASQLFSSSSSLNIILNSHPSQESCLTDIRLDPIELRVENPFDAIDFSFMNGTAPPPPPSSNSDVIMSAYGDISELTAKKLTEWTEVQMDKAMKGLFVLISASNDPSKTEALTDYKDRVVSAFEAYSQYDKLVNQKNFQVETSLAEVNKYREKYAKLVEDQKLYEVRREKFHVKKVKVAELERELAEVKAECCELLRVGTEFTRNLDRIQSEMKQEEARLADRVIQMRHWHEESNSHRQVAEQICEDWENAPQVNLASLLH